VKYVEPSAFADPLSMWWPENDEGMRVGNRVAVICILLVAVLIAAAPAAKDRECRSHGQADADCLRLAGGKPLAP
jgi:hypothetical protein